MSRTTRRQFFSDAFLSASLAGLTAAADRAQAAPLLRRRPGPNDRVRVACIGLRGRGMSHVEGYLAQPDCDLVALCDIDLNVVARPLETIAKAGRPRPKVYQDLRLLLQDKEIDAVSLALPIHWHALASIWAMQAGKDVYCEKPVSHNVSEGRRSAEAAQKYRRICQVGTQSRSAKAVRDAMQFIHDGKIGKVTLSRGLCYKRRDSIGILPDGAVPAHVDYDLWLGPAPARPFNPNRFHYNWHWMWDYGTGDLGNQGIHQMDIARWALGRESLPESVVAIGGRFGYVDQGETPNTAVALFDYGDAPLIFEVRGLRTEPLQGVAIGDIIYGTEGTVVIGSNYGAAVALDRSGKEMARFSGGGDHFRNFIDAVKSRKSADLHAPITDGHLSSALCHLGNVSLRLGQEAPFSETRERWGDDAQAKETLARFEKHLTDNGVRLSETKCRVGRPLAIDPRRESFGRNREANRLLTREYRAPFVVPEKV